MLLMMLEKNLPLDEIIFCDTGLDFPAMKTHINKVEEYIGRPIVRLKSKYSFEYLMFDYPKKRGKSKGHKGYGWPRVTTRWCTRSLKLEVSAHYLSKYPYTIEYIGIASDEAHRKKKNPKRRTAYPLIDWGITGEDALDYCYSKGFHWDGLYDKFTRVSCYLCPFQQVEDLRTLYRHFPLLWQKLKAIDNRNIEQFQDTYKHKWNVWEYEIRFDFEEEVLAKGEPINDRYFFWRLENLLEEQREVYPFL